MTAPIPVKAFDKIHAEMSSLSYTMGDYLELDDPRLMKWADELERLPRSQKFLGLALLRHLIGDIDDAERMFARAETAGAADENVMAIRLPVYINLGFASRALEICKTIFSVQALNLGVGLQITMTCGGVGFARDILKAAALAGVDLSNVTQYAQIVRITEAQSLKAVEDISFSKVLDAAGKVMRKHSLFWLEHAPRFSYDGEMGCLGVRYRMDMTPESADRINEELIELLIESDLVAIPITVSFVGTQIQVAELA